MWERFKRFLGGGQDIAPPAPEHDEHKYKWYEPGDGNPFGIRILDIRSFTWNFLSFTKDSQVAQSFGRQRHTMGREFIDATIEDSVTTECQLVFPHNGETLAGVVFKADCMEVKWDIYIYDSVFLFVRSWTGQLQYRAWAEFAPDQFTIHTIESRRDMLSTAPQTVKFLLATHAMRQVLPHTIPRETRNDPEAIAQLSFSMFGKVACYATYEDILGIEIRRPSG